MMKKYVLAASLGTVLLAGCQTTGGRGGLFNPVPYEPKISNPTDVVETTKEHLKAGQGALERVLFNVMVEKQYKDYGSFRFYGYNGTLPNSQPPNGLTEIRGVWEKNCGLRKGLWKYPICFQADGKGVIFVTHSIVTRSGKAFPDLEFQLFDTKDSSLATQEAMLKLASAQFFELSSIRYAENRVDALVQMNRGIEKIQKGLFSVPDFSSVMLDEGEARMAAVSTFALLNSPRIRDISYRYKDALPMRIMKLESLNIGSQECINLTFKRIDRYESPRPFGGNRDERIDNTICKDPKVEGHWTWRP